MHSRITSIIAAGLAAAFLWSAPSHANETCYEEVPGTPEWSCGGGIHGHGSADFVHSCGWGPTPVVRVEVECEPPAAMWVQRVEPSNSWTPGFVSAPASTRLSAPVRHAHFCAYYGMRPAEIQGQWCASANRRPRTGANWNGIVYPYPGTVPNSGLAQPFTSGGNYVGTGTLTALDACTVLQSDGTSPRHDYHAGAVAFYCETCGSGHCPAPVGWGGESTEQYYATNRRPRPQ